MKVQEILDESPQVPKTHEEHKRPKALASALRHLIKLAEDSNNDKNFPEGTSWLNDAKAAVQSNDHKQLFSVGDRIRSAYTGYSDTLGWLHSLRQALLND